MRNSFIDELVIHAKKNSNIALVVGDLGYSVVEPFADLFPERFINAGVAEQNMMGLAAGMASEGYHVFVYSIGNFPTFRCAEHVRNDIDYHQLPVTIVAVGGGLSYGSLGYSHHTIQDYALMRSMPNMLLASPGDPMEVRACLRYLITNPQPSYLRLGKSGEAVFHDEVPNVVPGEWLPIKKFNCTQSGSIENVILSTGGTLSDAIKLAESTDENNCRLYSLPLWGQSHKALQPKYAEGLKSLTTVEEHLVDGGFGSWMLESIFNAEGNMPKITIKALDAKVCGMVGSQEELKNATGVTL